jgi:hypothetical protein
VIPKKISAKIFLTITAVFLLGAPMVFAASPAQSIDMVTLDKENQDYLGALTVLDGRMMAVMGLYRENQNAEAQRQIDLAAIMGRDLQGLINQYGGDDPGPVLAQMQDRLKKGQTLDDVAETYAEWRNALLGIRFQTPYSLGTQLRSVAVAVKQAADLYQSSLAVDGGTIAQMQDYQAAFGIVQAGKQVIQLYIGETTTDDQRQVFENIITELDGLDTLLPGIIPPNGLRIDGKGFIDAAARIEVIALTLR